MAPFILQSLLPNAPPYCLCSFPTGFQEPVSFKVICVLSFHNSSWVQSLCSGWLGELQTHGWKNNPGTIIYLWPWSKGNFSNEELMEMQNFFHINFVRFVQAFYSLAKKWKLECKFIFLNRDWGYDRGCVGFNEFISLRNSLQSILKLKSPHHRIAIVSFWAEGIIQTLISQKVQDFCYLQSPLSLTAGLCFIILPHWSLATASFSSFQLGIYVYIFSVIYCISFILGYLNLHFLTLSPSLFSCSHNLHCLL